eukprot:6182056-Pleurochrysis_carterae.AAC.1
MEAAWEAEVTADSEAAMVGVERILLEEPEDLAARAMEAKAEAEMEEVAKAGLREEAKVGAAKERSQPAGL